jgi:hypothetical protein
MIPIWVSVGWSLLADINSIEQRHKAGGCKQVLLDCSYYLDALAKDRVPSTKVAAGHTWPAGTVYEVHFWGCFLPTANCPATSSYVDTENQKSSATSGHELSQHCQENAWTGKVL